MVDLAELVSDDPFGGAAEAAEAAAERTVRGVRAPHRYNEPQPEGVAPELPTLGGVLASAVDPFGIPSAVAGDLISPEFRDKWRSQYEGEGASQLIASTLTGGPVAAGVRSVARPVMDAMRAHKIIGPTVAGAAALPLAADAAGVQTDRPAESFEVPLPEPDPRLVEEHNTIQDKIGPITASFEAKLQQMEAAFQQRSTAKDARGQGVYPTTRARELDAAQHEKAREALRAQWKEQTEPLREEAKEIATRIRWQQENQKKERQAQAKAQADMQAAKEARERPLVEQYPALLALPYLGGAYSAGVTYSARRQAIQKYNEWAKQAGEQLSKVDKLVAAAEKTGKKVARPASETIEREKQVLSGFAERAPKAEKAATSTGFLPAAGSGALIAAELAMAPYLIDWATQEPESAAGKEARQRLVTLDGWMKTGTSALAGITGAGIGSTAPTPKIGTFPMERAKVMSQPGGYANAPAAQQPRQPAGPVGLPPAQFSKDAAKARQGGGETPLYKNTLTPEQTQNAMIGNQQSLANIKKTIADPIDWKRDPERMKHLHGQIPSLESEIAAAKKYLSKYPAKGRQKTAEESLQSIEQQLASGQN